MHEARLYYTNILNKALSETTSGSVFVSGKIGIDTDFFLENIEKIRKAQRDFIAQEIPIFDQIPYLDVSHHDAPRNYEIKFEIFYQGILSSGKISQLFVLKDSLDARGVQEEIQFAQMYQIPIVYED